ncbi:MAG: AmmeMemoRadiSam system protein B [Actinomycetota bacterium]
MTIGAMRTAVAAGAFYPGERAPLIRTVDRLLGATRQWTGTRPWGIVVPHAGYRYSGPVAASAYAAVLSGREAIARIVVIGPAHFVPLAGCAVPSAGAWRTPLGDASIDVELREVAIRAGCGVDDGPHTSEHSLEVQLPFLQRVLGKRLRFLPVAIGQAPADDVAAVLSDLAGHADLVVVSTDLSHYHDVVTARLRDRRTADAVQALDADAIGPSDACGVFALRGAVSFARRAGMSIRLLDLRTSGDTAGDPDRVVGYGAFAIER